MSMYDKKVEVLRKYARSISKSCEFHVGSEVPQKKIDNAMKKFAQGLDPFTIIGFMDTSLTNSGKNGYVFTDTMVYYVETLESPRKLKYDEIDSVEIGYIDRKNDNDRTLVFHLKNDSRKVWSGKLLYKTPLYHFFQELLELEKEEKERQKRLKEEIKQSQFKNTQSSFAGSISAGSAMGTYGTVNKLFNEEKFHARQGHGFAAERANHLYDKLKGKDAKIVGDDNAKNGADRIVNGIEIQSKYCATGSRCINECFENGGKGAFRYYSNNGKPMQIEVPSDQYDGAIAAMEEKIKRGQINGVTNPEDAKKIVRKGNFTYNQAKNISKAGTVESITYDAANGAVIASSAFGVSAVLTFATSIWNGEDFDIALKNATYSGIKVGGTAFITSILASQLSKAGLNSALVGSTEAIVGLMGPKASAVLVNAFKSGSNIYGAAAMKSAAKLLRGNIITAGVTVVVLSSFDIANIFRGRISGKQLFKNFANTTSTVAGGTAGWVGGAAIGSAILPGIGTIIGGLIGSVGAGAVASKTTDAILGTFIEDDADEMVAIIEREFSNLAVDYLLNQKEAENIVNVLQYRLDGGTLKDMFASDNRGEYARRILIPMIEAEVSVREKIKLPTVDQFTNSLKTVMEELADTME